MFRTVPLSIISSYSLYTQRRYNVCHTVLCTIHHCYNVCHTVLCAIHHCYNVCHTVLCAIHHCYNVCHTVLCAMHHCFATGDTAVLFVGLCFVIYLFILFFIFYFLFCTVTNKCTIISQIFTLLNVSTLQCHPQTVCNHYLAKLHQYLKCSCW
jgi:hypothetical protein